MFVYLYFYIFISLSGYLLLYLFLLRSRTFVVERAAGATVVFVSYVLAPFVDEVLHGEEEACRNDDCDDDVLRCHEFFDVFVVCLPESSLEYSLLSDLYSGTMSFIFFTVAISSKVAAMRIRSSISVSTAG